MLTVRDLAPNPFTDAASFTAVCAAIGQRARCCAIPVVSCSTYILIRQSRRIRCLPLSDSLAKICSARAQYNLVISNLSFHLWRKRRRLSD